MKIFKFSADWCDPCKVYAPIFDKVVAKFSNLWVERINVEKNPEIAGIHQVMSIPCTIILNLVWDEIYREVWIIKDLEKQINELKNAN